MLSDTTYLLTQICTLNSSNTITLQVCNNQDAIFTKTVFVNTYLVGQTVSIVSVCAICIEICEFNYCLCLFNDVVIANGLRMVLLIKLYALERLRIKGILCE